MTKGKKKKIVILGGGMGAMTAALQITEQKQWRQSIESVTVYQLGWRLGGKGASGRGECGRIEEHGLHIWMGFYDNAFRLIQQAYKELVEKGLRKPDAPLATWQEAFKKHSLIVLEEHIDQAWENWQFDCPENPLVPGSDTPLGFLDYLYMMVEWIFKHYFYQGNGQGSISSMPGEDTEGMLGHWLLKEIRKNKRIDHPLGKTKSERDAHWQYIWAFLELAILFRDHWKHNADAFYHDTAKRRRFILFDMGVTFLDGLKGLIQDYMKKNGIDHWYQLTSAMLAELDFDSLDHDDLRTWMKKYGAADMTLDSAIIRSFYDLVFAFENGEPDKPSFAAGVALRSMLRIAFSYKGAIFWKMQAGMGDVVFTPIYQVLKARGVRFEFFHRVKDLGLSANKKAVHTVTLGRQVTLKGSEYNPLVDIKGLPCWPSEPVYEQIVDSEAAELKAEKINLESFFTPWKDRQDIVLKAGEDFDEVVFGISLGSVPYVCPQLVLANKKWKKMADNVQTVRTQALQLWFDTNLKDLGWQDGSPVLCGYVDPLNTWADMSQLIDKENWPHDHSVNNIAYYCGPMVGDIPPQSDREAPQQAWQQSKRHASEFCHQAIDHLMPLATQSGTTELNWNLLVDLQQQQGPQRLVSQYIRANIDPSERYVLSVAASTQYRIEPQASGFQNLYLAGDWTLNGFNAGCIEATVMSGMLASYGICGYPQLDDIWGWDQP